MFILQTAENSENALFLEDSRVGYFQSEDNKSSFAYYSLLVGRPSRATTNPICGVIISLFGLVN